MPSVLFVCLGNICRSPAAEGVMLEVVARAGLSEMIQVDSAGTGGWHVGNRADSRMRSAALARGYDLQSRARQVETMDFDHFDLVVPMDHSNLENLQQLSGAATCDIRLLGSFLPPELPPKPEVSDVPDPYYGGEDGFNTVLDILERACPKVLEVLQQK